MFSKTTLLASSGLVALSLFASSHALAATKHVVTKTTEVTTEATTTTTTHKGKGYWTYAPVLHRVWHKGGHRVAHHHLRKVTTTSTTETMEMDGLKAQVAALTARLNAAESANKATSDQVAVVQANSAKAAAATSAQVAATQAAIAGQIKSAVTASIPKPSVASTTINGTVFANMSNISYVPATSTGVKAVPSGTGFDVRRAYIGVDHVFDKTFSASALIDFDANSAPYSANAATAGQYVYIKSLFMQAKISPALALRAGIVPTSWLPFADSQYNNTRYIENSLTDRYKQANAADVGIQALGDLVGANGKGVKVSYTLNLVNGGGYKNPTRSNTMDVEGRLSASYKGFMIATGGYSGRLAKDTQGVTPLNTAKRADFMVGYSNARFSVTGEYFYSKNYFSELGTNLITSNMVDSARGWELAGKVNLTPKLNVFARYDHVAPSFIQFRPEHDNYYNMGVGYALTKGIDLALVYKHDGVVSSGGSNLGYGLATQEQTLGGAAKNQATWDEFGLYTQFKF
jgi:hypothetical protein